MHRALVRLVFQSIQALEEHTTNDCVEDYAVST
jgi:hypothetical protein